MCLERCDFLKPVSIANDELLARVNGLPLILYPLFVPQYAGNYSEGMINNSCKNEIFRISHRLVINK